MSVYFVDPAAADDTGAGTSPGAAWQTVAKVNASSFSAGDAVLFKRGGTWREQLTVPSSGSAGNPITFGAYGSGADPVVNGSNLVTAWTDNSVGTHLFVDGFESGDLSAWTTETDTGSKLSVVGGSVMDGTSCVRVTNANTTVAHLKKSFTQLASTAWYAEFKVRLDSSFAVGDYSGTGVQLLQIDHSAWGMIFEVFVVNDGTDLKWKINRNRPSFTTVTTSTTLARDTTYTVRVSSTGIGGTSGTYDFSIDGVSIYSATGLALNSNAEKYQPDQWQLGVYTSTAAAPAGNLYFDAAWIDTSTTGSGGTANTWKATVSTEPKIVHFNGTRGTNVASVAACNADKKWYWSAGSLYTYGTGDPNATYPSQIEAGARDYCIDVCKSHVTITGVEVAKANQSGLRMATYSAAADLAGFVATNVVAHDCYQHGIWVNSGATYGIDTVTIGGASGAGNTAYNNGLAGIYVDADQVYAITNATISWNTAHHNCWRTDTIEFGGIKVWNEAGTGTLVEHNTSYSNKPASAINQGHGIVVSRGTTAAVVRFNTVYDNRDGFYIQRTSNVQLAYNVSYGNTAAGIEVGNATISANAVENNVCYGNYDGLVVWSYTPAAGGVTNNLVKNNVLTGNTHCQLRALNGGENDGTNGSGNVYTYNCFGPESANFIEWGSGVFKSTYAAWATAYGAATHAVSGDPLFVNAAGADFHLQSTSPCRDAGVDVGLTTDYAGVAVPQGSAPDIGAYEYGAVVETATPRGPTNGRTYTVDAGAGNTALIAAGERATQFLIVNDSLVPLYVLFQDGTASETNYSVKVAANGSYTSPRGVWELGAISGCWLAQTGVARITLLTW